MLYTSPLDERRITNDMGPNLVLEMTVTVKVSGHFGIIINYMKERSPKGLHCQIHVSFNTYNCMIYPFYIFKNIYLSITLYVGRKSNFRKY